MTLIPPFRAIATNDEIAAVHSAINRIMQTEQLTLGAYTHEFEQRVAAMAGTRHAVAVSSGSTALEIIFRALNVKDRVVLVPTNTNFATAAAALRAGARVHLYDGGLYPEITPISARLDSDVAAVVAVHIGGHMAPHLPDIAALCQRAGVALIEDAAHAHGSFVHNRPAGSFGVAAGWSFFATKVCSTGGEGGAITTNDPDLAEAARRYRNQGKDNRGRHILMGNSWRLPEINAAMGSAQLARLHLDVADRRAVLDTYADVLTPTGLGFPVIGEDAQVSGHKAVALLPDGVDRERLYALVADRGVQLGRGVYEQPLHRQPIFAELGLNTGDEFPIADVFADRHVCLPLWRCMAPEVVETVIGAVSAGMATLGQGLG